MLNKKCICIVKKKHFNSTRGMAFIILNEWLLKVKILNTNCKCLFYCVSNFYDWVESIQEILGSLYRKN
jgi:hypothetical protein